MELQELLKCLIEKIDSLSKKFDDLIYQADSLANEIHENTAKM